MRVPVSARIARREMRGGLRNFRIFLACLALGIAAIAAVGSVRTSIEQGLHREGATILGGDAEMEFTYRFASEQERAFMSDRASQISEIVDFRSMAVVRGGARGLTQVKAVDDAYPLVGHTILNPDMPLTEAFARKDGVPGAIMHPVLADRLQLLPGDRFLLGTQEFRLAAILVREPDSASQGFGLGPRSIVLEEDLSGSGLISAGSLFETRYRMLLRPGGDLEAIKLDALSRFRDTGMRWHDKRSGAPGIETFVDRMGSFLVLVALAGLAVGGIGVGSAVRTYLETKTRTIATLKTLGADSRMIFRIYFLQIGALAVLGIALGLGLGAFLPVVFAPLIASQLPLPVEISVHGAPLVEAAAYGALTAALFTLWPLARSRDIRPASLFRDAISSRFVLPAWRYLGAMVALLLALFGVALWYASVPWLVMWTFGGILGALGVLVVAAFAIRLGAHRVARARAVQGRTALRMALGAVGGPASEAMPVILSLGLGLTVLASVGQIDGNLRDAITDELPDVAPAFFFVDIQKGQLQGFTERTRNDPDVSRVETAPMLRGVITRINGRPAREVAGDHWVITGDRGITYSKRPPPRTTITKGAWWPEDYTGPAQISFSRDEALELGLDVGDRLTVNILGRDIQATITSLRVVDFSSAGIGFVLTMNPGAVAGAPHTFISTVYAKPRAEAGLLRDLGERFPNITAISVREAIERVAGALSGLAAATSLGALATLLTGFVVLIGAAAAGERAREYEAAILKTLGASRARILLSFAIRSALMGAAAGLVAIFAGAVSGWAVMVYVMDLSYTFEPVSAFVIVLGGAVITLVAGLLFALRPLSTQPARVLRQRE